MDNDMVVLGSQLGCFMVTLSGTISWLPLII